MNLTRRLSEGVGAWLHYEYTCNRTGLFNERYLAFAVGNILSAVLGNRVYSEVKHPVLSHNAVGTGRRPSIDFASFGDAGYPDIKVAVETKWAGSSHTSPKTILWDLIRLEMLAHKYSAQCIFLLAGKRTDLARLFQRLALRGIPKTGDVSHILSVKSNNRHTFSLLPDKYYKVAFLRKAFTDAQDIPIPHRVVTQRALPFPREGPVQHFQAYAWMVSSAANREAFLPSAIKHYAQH